MFKLCLFLCVGAACIANSAVNGGSCNDKVKECGAERTCVRWNLLWNCLKSVCPQKELAQENQQSLLNCKAVTSLETGVATSPECKQKSKQCDDNLPKLVHCDELKKEWDCTSSDCDKHNWAEEAKKDFEKCGIGLPWVTTTISTKAPLGHRTPQAQPGASANPAMALCTQALNECPLPGMPGDLTEDECPKVEEWRCCLKTKGCKENHGLITHVLEEPCKLKLETSCGNDEGGGDGGAENGGNRVKDAFLIVLPIVVGFLVA